ncbi:MAG: hypothetical protein HN885_06450 [Nitrospina sp.]|nr:hypothetical protein [Nitrospina sp.]MBT7272623.1 hypothetical protein [Nitrospina sp.]
MENDFEKFCDFHGNQYRSVPDPKRTIRPHEKNQRMHTVPRAFDGNNNMKFFYFLVLWTCW